MTVIPLELKLTCTFGTLDSENNFVLKKDTFNVDIQKLDHELFARACDQLLKIKNDLAMVDATAMAAAAPAM
jgi:hypothetical protein